MEYHFREYRDSDLPACAALIPPVWPFERELEHPLRPESIYEYYILHSAMQADYREVVADEADRAQGLLFAGPFPAGNRFDENRAAFCGWIADRFATGDFGVRGPAEGFMKFMEELDQTGSALAEKGDFDGVVYLFLMGAELRGKGIGRKLMDRYLADCRSRELQGVCLWTTEDCTWQFYEQYGFRLMERFCFPVMESGKPNAMVYGMVL